MSDDQERLRAHLDDLWRWKCGLPPLDPSFSALARSEWSPTFERAMRLRLIMGALRYGKIGEAGKPKYDRVKSMVKRLGNYAETGNLEMLVDVANLALLEWCEGDHSLRHFHAVDDGEHVEVVDKAANENGGG